MISPPRAPGLGIKMLCALGGEQRPYPPSSAGLSLSTTVRAYKHPSHTKMLAWPSRRAASLGVTPSSIEPTVGVRPPNQRGSVMP